MSTQIIIDRLKKSDLYAECPCGAEHKLSDLLLFDGTKPFPAARARAQVDVLILIPREAMIFVEAKYKSPISKRTTHDQERDQIIRNVDVGTNYANLNALDFYFILCTRKCDKKSKQFLDVYRNNPEKMISKLSHRVDIRTKKTKLDNVLGYITWEDLSKIRLKN